MVTNTSIISRPIPNASFSDEQMLLTRNVCLYGIEPYKQTLRVSSICSSEKDIFVEMKEWFLSRVIQKKW